jgi:transcriptional regulator with XRE-family HTH domain
MPSNLKQFTERALSRSDVRPAYDEMEDEFSFLRQILAARASAGLTQAQVAARIGTTQSAVARLESGAHKHSPSIVTLQRYARALGFRLDVRLVKDGERRSGSKSMARKA